MNAFGFCNKMILKAVPHFHNTIMGSWHFGRGGVDAVRARRTTWNILECIREEVLPSFAHCNTKHPQTLSAE